MSLIEHAKAELARINFGEDDSRVMIEILQKFFDQWDSGGAVWAAAPVLQRLIAGQPLSPLTGEDSEWYDPMGNGEMLQNVRCGTVFKNRDGMTYDIDNPKGVFEPIVFPYWPARAEVSDPVAEIAIQ